MIRYEDLTVDSVRKWMEEADMTVDTLEVLKDGQVFRPLALITEGKRRIIVYDGSLPSDIIDWLEGIQPGKTGRSMDKNGASNPASSQ